jgi:hypothetical protein
VRIVVLLAIAAVLVGCGSDPDGPRADPPPAPRYESADRGFSVLVPPGWHRADSKVTVLGDPVETLVVATYSPRPGGPDCGPLAFAGFDENQALVIVLERGLDAQSTWPDFPPRPAHFRYEPGKASEFTDCLRTKYGIRLKDHWFTFTDAGRHFHVLVVIGDLAPRAVAAEAYELLDSLRFDPAVRPDWPSAG